MRRFLALTVWAMGLAWVLTSVVLPPGSASAALPAAVPAGPMAVTPPGGYISLAPSRLLDTGSGVGADQAAVAAYGTIHLQVSGRGGVPASGVSAVVLNVTVTAPTKAGFLSVYGEGDALPGTSNLNFVAAQTVPNLVIAAVGIDGKVAFHNGSGGTVQLVADVSGYFRSGAATVAGAFGSLSPSRLLDTRTGVGGAKIAVAAGGTVHLQVNGSGGVPASGVSAVVLNVTVKAPTKAGSMSVYGDGDAVPGTPNLNFVAARWCRTWSSPPSGRTATSICTTIRVAPSSSSLTSRGTTSPPSVRPRSRLELAFMCGVHSWWRQVLGPQHA